MTTFGATLRDKRRATGISQRELAQKIGVDFSYISKLENDRLAPPAAETITAICEVLNIAPEELFSTAGKIPADVQKTMSESKAAQEFLRDAQHFELSDEEWSQLRHTLRKLRGNNK